LPLFIGKIKQPKRSFSDVQKKFGRNEWSKYHVKYSLSNLPDSGKEKYQQLKHPFEQARDLFAPFHSRKVGVIEIGPYFAQHGLYDEAPGCSRWELFHVKQLSTKRKGFWVD